MDKTFTFDFDKFNERRGTGCVKWDGDSRDVIPMWVADMDFQTAPCIIDAVKARVNQGIFGYTRVRDEYYNAICSWFGRRHGWNVQKDWIIYTSGVVPALSAVIKAFTKPGDSVLIQTPVYNCFFSSIRNNGCKMLENRLIQDVAAGNGEGKVFTYSIDFEDFEEKVKSASLFVLCNPHNPAGRVWSKEELTKMSEICLKYNVPVISDEIHCEIVMPGQSYIPTASLSDEIQQNTVTLCSPSKAFNIAGLQIANIVTSREDWRTKIDKAININEICDVNPFGVEALIAAYTDSCAEQWLDELNHYIYENYKYLLEIFGKELPWLPVSRLEGTYLVWCDCRSLGMSSEAIEQALVKDFKVHINAGSMYGDAGEGFIRINLASPRSLIADGLTRIIRGLNSMQTR